jgi:hypothetical protein
MHGKAIKGLFMVTAVAEDITLALEGNIPIGAVNYIM